MVQLLHKTVWWFLKKSKPELLHDQPPHVWEHTYAEEPTQGLKEIIFPHPAPQRLGCGSNSTVCRQEQTCQTLSNHTVNYYSALKRNSTLTQAATCTGLEGVMCRELCRHRGQLPEPAYTRHAEPSASDGRRVAAAGGRGWGMLFHGQSFHFTRYQELWR